MSPTEDKFIALWTWMAECTYTTTLSKGFDYKDQPSKLLMMHEEISEACAALRTGNPPSKKLPGFTEMEEEMADLVLRTMGFCHANGYRLAEAIIAKEEYNQSRPDKHGGKVF